MSLESNVWITHDVAGDAKRADRIIAIENRSIGYCGPASGYEGVRTGEAVC